MSLRSFSSRETPGLVPQAQPVQLWYKAAVKSDVKGSGALVRSIGRWSLAALTVNSIIGSGIYGLPSIVLRQVGRAAPFTWGAAALFSGAIMLCFAEVASRFDQSGGPYLYARTAFGRFGGILVAWLVWLVRLASAAAAANLFVTYLTEFWSRATETGSRLLVLSLLIGVIAYVNCRGMSAGTKFSNVFTVAKLLPLAIFIVIGAAYLGVRHPGVPQLHVSPPLRTWLNTMLLLVF